MPTQQELSPEDHQNREVHARYGLAMYYAQAVEASIKSALVLAKVNESVITNQADFEDTWTDNFTATMGRLLQRFKPYLGGDDEIGEDLQLALKVRNQLAHHFYWDHTGDILTTAGRQRMITECGADAEFFHELNERVFEVSNRYADAMGIRPGPFDEALVESMADEPAEDSRGHGVCGRCSIQMVSAGTVRRPYWECMNCRAVALA